MEFLGEGVYASLEGKDWEHLQRALLMWLKEPSRACVHTVMHGHNSQDIGCPLFVRFISNQP